MNIFISVIVTCKGRLRFLKQTAPRLMDEPDMANVLVVHDKLGLFDDTYMAAGDHEMWVRMLDAGMRFVEIQMVTSIFYKHKGSLTAMHNGNHEEIERIIAKYGGQYR